MGLPNLLKYLYSTLESHMTASFTLHKTSEYQMQFTLNGEDVAYLAHTSTCSPNHHVLPTDLVVTRPSNIPLRLHQDPFSVTSNVPGLCATSLPF